MKEIPLYGRKKMFYGHIGVAIGLIMLMIFFKFCNANLQEKANPGIWTRAANQVTIKK